MLCFWDYRVGLRERLEDDVGWRVFDGFRRWDDVVVMGGFVVFVYWEFEAWLMEDVESSF